MKTKKKNSRFSGRLGVVVLLLVAFSFGYLFGHGNMKLDQRYIPRLVNTDFGKPEDVDFGLFWQVYDELSRNYLRTMDAEKALYGAINGLVLSLEDPYSSFLTPEESKTFQEELSGKLEGIGAEIGRRNGVPTIITPLKNSPAEKAGLEPGDQILAVDSEYTDKLSLDAVIAKIRGKRGTEVVLTIVRNSTEPKEYKIIREAINVQDVTWEREDDVAVITMRQFGDNSTAQLSQAASEIKNAGISRIILDLRNNPGGLLDKAVEVAGFFLPAGSVVVKEQLKDGEISTITTEGEPTFAREPLVVMVNKGSASASEIVAGAMREYKRGLVLGEKTYGKGTVQIFKDLKLGAALKLTIAQWLTPQGHHIEKNGIEPDIVVEYKDGEVEEGGDPQLEKALSEIRKR
ncbi:MAG TPA: S41 family peptidase [bacterium]|nr:S41 family peptidase [bacterium]HOR57589.1 S41 family peptidase [bacterium]HPL55976.1 S41 family peptidase [bacterium]